MGGRGFVGMLLGILAVPMALAGAKEKSQSAGQGVGLTGWKEDRCKDQLRPHSGILYSGSVNCPTAPADALHVLYHDREFGRYEAGTPEYEKPSLALEDCASRCNGVLRNDFLMKAQFLRLQGK